MPPHTEQTSTNQHLRPPGMFPTTLAVPAAFCTAVMTSRSRSSDIQMRQNVAAEWSFSVIHAAMPFLLCYYCMFHFTKQVRTASANEVSDRRRRESEGRIKVERKALGGLGLQSRHPGISLKNIQTAMNVQRL
ncbi:unnamed protein product [Pleuronectes platessa]|uniref:Uncharacterized protein n=1 Tax=Pleuronectes platessa TaxID=8262 RepID=A0A9N7TKU1_PLEPL|nr:unnamed protein product [Pleuronectes platessa]